MTEHQIVTVSGQLPKIKESSVRRLAVYVVSGREVLSASPVTGAGTFQLHVVHALVAHEGASAVLGPKGLDPQALLQRTDLPRLALSSAKSAGHNAYTLDVSALNVSDRLIDPWWIWCREYKVSGTLQTGGDCPVGALVTVYNVTSGVSGLIATPIETVPTGPDGKFTANFNWCSRLCWWPCWPIWWQCWPWWWERDILAVIENIERQIDRTDFANAKPRAFASAPLGQPSPADLMIGAGFSGARSGALQPDSARTALIASKFANPRIRELFPWWWWCCDNPNILFSAAQGTVTVLDEDPNVSTRWCFASGQTVSLTANSQAVGACQVQTGGPCGFAWSSVGDEPGGVLVSDISSGYANGSFGSAASNAAFTGTLNLNGIFSGDCAAFYQVLAGQWGGGGPGILTAGNPARGGTPPTSSPPLSVPLYDTITIWSGGVPTQVSVYLGPCSFGGVDTLYVTRAFRQIRRLASRVCRRSRRSRAICGAGMRRTSCFPSPRRRWRIRRPVLAASR